MPTIAETLIFVERILRRETQCTFAWTRLSGSGSIAPTKTRDTKNSNRTRNELIAEIISDYERHGDAMRYLGHTGQIAWKASPAMLRKLVDAERELEDDWRVFRPADQIGAVRIGLAASH